MPTLTRLPNQRFQWQGRYYKLVGIPYTPASLFQTIGMKDDFVAELTQEQLAFVNEDPVENGPKIVLRRCEGDLGLTFEELGFGERKCQHLTRNWYTDDFDYGNLECKPELLRKCAFGYIPTTETRTEDTNELVDFTELMLGGLSHNQNGFVHIPIDSSRLR
jgi:hypothetical protein